LAHRRPDVTVEATHALTPELAVEIADAPLVVFVDAQYGDCPGHVHVDRLDDNPGAASSPHGLSPAALLEYSARLFGRRPPAFLITVEGARFDVGAALSAEVRHAIPEVLAAIEWVERRSARLPRGHAEARRDRKHPA